MSVSGNRQQRTPGASASSVDDIASQMSAREAKALYKEAARRDKERAEFEKRRNKKRRQRASTQNAIKYEAMDPDGICRIEPGLYSTALAASNVSYTALVENDQAAAFEAWCDFLNTMGSEVSLEIHVHNTLPDQEDVEDRLLYKMTGRPSDAYREDFNRLIADASQGNVLLNAPEIVYVFSVEAESKDAALVSLKELQRSCINYCQAQRRDCRILNGVERLERIAACFRPYDILMFDYAALGRSQTTKDAVAPGYINYVKSGAASSSMLQVEDLFMKTYMMTWVPSKMKDSFLAELLSLGINAYFGLHIHEYDHERALAIVNDKIKNADMEKEGAKKGARRRIEDPEAAQSDELRGALGDLKSMKNDLENENQNYYSFSLYCVIYGNTRDEVLEHELKMKKVAGKYSYRISPAGARPIEALNSALPIGKPLIPARSTGVTYEVGTFIPLSGTDISSAHENNFYGIDPETGAPIFASRRHGLSAPHAMSLGVTGYGKSMGTKGEATQVLLRGEEQEDRLGRKTKQILLSDPENETMDWVRQSGGEFINFIDGGHIIINPCDLHVPKRKENDGYSPIANKASYFKGLIDQIYPISPEMSAVFDAEIMVATREMYAPLEARGWTGNMPVLSNLRDKLYKSSYEQVKMGARALDAFAQGAYGNFEGQTDVNLDNSLISFGFKDTSETTKTLAIYITTNLMWQRLMSNHDESIETWLYFDEFQHQIRRQKMKEFFFEVYSRARKRGGIATASTQTPENVLDDAETRAVIKNCGMVTMYYMMEDDVRTLGDLLNISDSQLNNIRKGLKGCGLYAFNNRAVPFKNLYDQDSEIYRLFKTSEE